MNRHCIWVGLLLAVGTSHAAMDFHGYRTVTYPRSDSARFELVYLGRGQLEASQVRITPRGSYFDIMEDAWISSDVERLNLAGLTPHYLFKGSLELSPMAVITGIETWRGDVAYRAVLRKSTYVHDRIALDSVALARLINSRIALLQQHTGTTYELTLAAVNLGERTRVRIRYLLPNDAANGTTLKIPVLFAAASAPNPRFVRVIWDGAPAGRSYTLRTSQSSIVLDSASTQMLPFSAALELRYDPLRAGLIHSTQFSTGPWQGNYLLLNAHLTDSTLVRLSRPIATVFVWRWNASEPVVASNGVMKDLTAYGQSIVRDAVRIKEAMKALRKLGNRSALIHSVDGEKGNRFAAAAVDDSSTQQAIRYLDSINAQWLYSQYANVPAPAPAWVPQTTGRETVLQQSRTDFLNSVEIGVQLLPAGVAAYRHVVVVGTGSPRYYDARELQEELAGKLQTVSISAGGLWQGVQLSTVALWAAKSELFTWNSFGFPAFTPSVVKLKVESSPSPYFFTFKNAGEALSISARTESAWDTVFHWIGYDDSGHQVSSVVEAPFVTRAPMDSGLAKIWAGDEHHIAEEEDVFPGGTFGIVTKATYLQATSDNLGGSAGTTVAFLSDDEIFAPRTAVSVNAGRTTTGVRVQYVHGVLHLRGTEPYHTLKIYDLRGRLLAVLRLSNMKRTGGELLLNCAAVLGSQVSRALVLRFEGTSAGYTVTFTFKGAHK